MTSIGMGADNRETRHTWWVAAALVGVAALVVWQLRTAREHAPVPHATDAQAISQHCEQFVAIAKAGFGPNWKPRLDPSDPLCAAEIQQAWERQRIPRPLAVPPPPGRPALVGPIAPPTPPEAVQPAAPRVVVEEKETARVELFCLNVLNLARTKFGDDWRDYLTTHEATTCQAYSQRMP